MPHSRRSASARSTPTTCAPGTAGRGSLERFTRSLGPARGGRRTTSSRRSGCRCTCASWSRGSPPSATARCPHDALDSIPFYSLCRGLFLPLSAMAPEKAAHLFGILVDPPPDAAAREALLDALPRQRRSGSASSRSWPACSAIPSSGTRAPSGATACLRCCSRCSSPRVAHAARPPDAGRRRRRAVRREPPDELRGEPPLTAPEVLQTLRFFPRARPRLQVRRCCARCSSACGKLEAYFLAKLLLRKAGFGFDYQGELLARIARRALRRPGRAGRPRHGAHRRLPGRARCSRRRAPAGLRAIQLQPLVPVRPALAGGTTDEIKRFPVWVERKYDGIRLMLHKSTDARRLDALRRLHAQRAATGSSSCPASTPTHQALPAPHGDRRRRALRHRGRPRRRAARPRSTRSTPRCRASRRGRSTCASPRST